MAEIQVERTRTRSATGWAILVGVLVALLGAGWYFVMGPGATTQADLAPAQSVEPTAVPGPSPTAATPPAGAGGAEGAPTPIR